MPTDPNAGVIKALQSHTRALEANTKATSELTKEIKARLPRSLTFTNHPYLKDNGIDGEDPGGESSGDAGLVEGDEKRDDSGA